MSSSDSSDFETGIAQQATQQQKSPASKKKKTRPTVVAQEDHGKNEGVDPRWAYEPPKDARMLEHAVDAGPFEWDTIKNDDDVEIWLIRVPDTIKPKHLEGLEIDPPSSSRTARIGGFTKKSTSYDVWSVGDDADVVGGEELRGLSCLLPRKRKDGRLYTAPKRVSQHIVVAAQPAVATPPELQPIIYQDPPRRSYPKEVLKHAFIPYGARSDQSRLANLSVDDLEPPDVARSSKDQSEKTKPESKGKKRKNEGDVSKSSKKHKMRA